MQIEKKDYIMQINKISSNNTTPAFGAKLVFRKGMFADDKTKKIIQKFENKTKNIDGTIYVKGFYSEDLEAIDQRNIDVFYKNNDYQDAITLKHGGSWPALNSSDITVEIMSRLLNTFKIRETAVNATKAAQEEIKKLKMGLNTTFEKMHEDMDKILDSDFVESFGPKTYKMNLKKCCKNEFANKEIDGRHGIRPSFNSFDTLADCFEEDCKYTNGLFNKDNV